MERSPRPFFRALRCVSGRLSASSGPTTDLRLLAVRSAAALHWRQGGPSLMKTAQLLILPLACALTARADFSYIQTQKAGGGMMAAAAAAAGNATTKHFLKGQKLKTDNGTTVLILDFDAQTITNINHTQKTYSVSKFADMGQALKNAGGEIKIDLKETGEKKTVNGFNASQVIMTMTMEGMQGAPAGTQAT